MKQPHAHPAGNERRARDTLQGTHWPDALIDILSRLREGGHRALLVGGTVRDVLLSRPMSGTFDVSTDLHPDEVMARFDRVEPIGLAHGTVLILNGGVSVECTTFRREGEYVDARRPATVAFTADPVADLARRDLTINALAFDPHDGTWLDPWHGLDDLATRTLRAVGDPLARFREDALRPLRVARFAATLEMDPEPATRSALGAALDRSAGVAAERVRDELSRMLDASRPSRGIELMRESGMLELWLPELCDCVDVPQNRHHAHDVYRHSLLVCDAAPADRPRVRWAALLHDIGKPGTRVERGGEGTFYGHEVRGAELADSRLRALRMPSLEREAIVHLVRQHMFDDRRPWTDAAVRRWLRRVTPDAVDDLFALREADVAGKGGAPASPWLAALKSQVSAVRAARTALHVTDLRLDGRDVMRALGIGGGPEVGEALAALLDDVIEDPSRNTRPFLLERLAEWKRERRSGGRSA